jgi:hypothetical protein
MFASILNRLAQQKVYCSCMAQQPERAHNRNNRSHKFSSSTELPEGEKNVQIIFFLLHTTIETVFWAPSERVESSLAYEKRISSLFSILESTEIHARDNSLVISV